MNRTVSIILIIITILGLSSCTTDDKGTGRISINFIHEVDGSALQTDTMQYVNEAGDTYSVESLKYFISNLKLIKSDGSIVPLCEEEKIIYIDNDLPATMYEELPDSVPAGVYKSLTFTFGIEEADNHSGLFTTPPETYMESTEELGGGYNYMRMSGRYAQTPGINEKNYNFFLGIGQIHPSTGLGADEVRYVHNDFPVTVSNISFELDKDEEVVINLIMDIQQWFQEPHEWDFQNIGGSIIENQDAQIMARENGENVFTAYVNDNRGVH